MACPLSLAWISSSRRAGYRSPPDVDLNFQPDRTILLQCVTACTRHEELVHGGLTTAVAPLPLRRISLTLQRWPPALPPPPL